MRSQVGKAQPKCLVGDVADVAGVDAVVEQIGDGAFDGCDGQAVGFGDVTRLKGEPTQCDVWMFGVWAR